MIDGDDLLSNSDDEAGMEHEKEAGKADESAGRLVVHTDHSTSGPKSGVNGQSSLSGDQPSSSHPAKDENLDSVLQNGSIQVFIRAYEKRGEGINAFLVYKIETRVSNIPGYTKSKLEVWRRFSDFLGLRENLMAKYQHKGILVPSAPEKSISALTKTKLATTDGDSSANEIADKR